jgi:hypothetical protein
MNDVTAVDVPPDAPPAVPPAAGLKSAEILAAEKAVAAIMTGVKNFGVFAPEHASTINMLQGVLRAITQYGEIFGSLIFEVERQSLVFQGKPIYEGPPGDDNPAFVLFRAGISRFEFAPGLEENEVVRFFEIYNHYRVMADEPDDDLVSALWRAGLPHIFYEASYELWSEAETAVDYDALSALAPADSDGPEVTARPGKGWEALRVESSSDNYRKVSLALLPNLNEYCALSQAEQETLLAMVAEDTPAGGSEAAVRLMFMLLARESAAPVHEAALGFLQEVYLNFLANRAFQRAYFILDNIRKEAMVAKESKPWALPAFEKFYGVVLQPEIIDSLVAAWPHFGAMGAMEVKALGAILQQLPAKIAAQLVAQFNKVEIPEAQKLFVEIIVQHARRDREVLAAALHSEVEQLTLAMLAVIRELNDRNLVEQLLPKFRYDSRSQVRQETMRILASHNIY